MTKKFLRNLLKEFRKSHILIIGDVGLDKLCFYSEGLSEQSRETNLPTLPIIKVEKSPGAAGNVAVNVKCLGIKDVFLIGVIGADGEGHDLKISLEGRGVSSKYLVESKQQQTITFTKFINLKSGKEDKGRVDLLNRTPVPKNVEARVIKYLEMLIPKSDGVIVVDQMEKGIGLITENIRKYLIKFNRTFPPHLFPLPQGERILLVDSRMRADKFPGFIIKPNQMEFAALLQRLLRKQISPTEDYEYLAIAKKFAPLVQKKNGNAVYITLGRKGSVVCDRGKASQIFTIEKENPVDICGAGDAFSSGVISTLAATQRLRGKPDFIAAGYMGNLCASIVVDKSGTGSASPKELLSNFKQIPVPKICHPGVEIINPHTPTGKFRFAIFDFDGTISLLREGWPEIMEEVMATAVCGEKQPSSEIIQKIKNFIDRTTGIQTILQMKGLVKMVKAEGIIPADQIKTAQEYKKIYQKRLLERKVLPRVKNIKGARYILKGAVDFLTRLKKKGLVLFLASGTDREDTVREAELLGIARFFAGRIYGALDSYRKYSKAKLIKELIEKNDLKGEELLVVGDGPVEIRVAKANGAVALGVASDEVKGEGLNPPKRERLIEAGADIIIPDFACGKELLDYLL